MAVLVALIGGGLAWRIGHPGAVAASAAVQGPLAAAPDRSIAVLPFVDMSEKHDQEYFADWMAEELLDVLVKIPGLKVIGRTSSFQFKGKEEDLRHIGQVLGAAHLVEGSVRRAGDHVRVTAQLIRSADGVHEWSQTYDQKVSDVLKLHEEIATRLARELQITVNSSALTADAAPSSEAYDLFLRGSHAFDKLSKAGLEQAVNDFQQAVIVDSNFTRAAEWLAFAHFVQADSGYVPAQVGFEHVREEAQQLIKADPRSLMGHALMGRIYTDYDWDWAAAEREAALATAISPSSYMGVATAQVLAVVRGQWEQAESLARSAVESDPLNADLHYWLGMAYWGAGRFSEAADEHRRMLDISPTYDYGHSQLGCDLLAMGRPEAALREMQLESSEDGRLYGLAVVYHALGKEVESASALQQLTRESAGQRAYEIATVHAFRGEIDQAVEWLDRAYRQKDSDVPMFKSEWLFRNLKGDARYQAFLKKMKLPET